MKSIRVLKKFTCKNGQLFYLSEGRRHLYTECDMGLEVDEESTEVPKIGNLSIDYKTHTLIIAFCAYEYRNVDCSSEFLRKVDGFDISVSVMDSSDKWQTVSFRNVFPDDVDDFGNWRFTINDLEQIKNLLKI